MPGFLCSLIALWEPFMFLCVGMSRLENMHLLSFSGFFSDCFPKECYQFILTSVVMRILFALLHSQYWYYLPCLFILAILVRDWWYHIVALICVSLCTSELSSFSYFIDYFHIIISEISAQDFIHLTVGLPNI